MSGKRKGQQPDRGKPASPGKGASAIPPPPEPPNPLNQHPLWCFHFIDPKFSADVLETEAVRALIAAFVKRSSLTWNQLIMANKHKLGTENIPVKITKPKMPPSFKDEEHFIVMRYHDKLPFGGVRVGRIFHVIWIERQFGEVYEHGGS